MVLTSCLVWIYMVEMVAFSAKKVN